MRIRSLAALLGGGSGRRSSHGSAETPLTVTASVGTGVPAPSAEQSTEQRERPQRSMQHSLENSGPRRVTRPV
eukprot:4494105-Prymnesium_polylepis.1